MSSGAMDLTLEIDGEEQEYYCEYDFSPSSPGSMYKRNGDPGDPPEAEEIDITMLKPYLPDHALGPDALSSLTEEDLESIEQTISEYEAECQEADDEYDDDEEDWDEGDEDEEDE